MNTNTKYYTPTIEEFHVGFEFEQKIGNSVSTKDEVWLKSIFSFIPNADKILEILSGDLIRVKLLDREDIESLGWIQRDYDTFDFGSNIAFEFIPEETSYIYTYGGGKNLDTIFKGTIKNKSELQKLMVQLNIKE